MSKHTPKSFKGQKLNSADLKIAINRTLKNQNCVTFSPAKLLKTLKISNSKPEVLSALNQLKKEGRETLFLDEKNFTPENLVAALEKDLFGRQNVVVFESFSRLKPNPKKEATEIIK